MTIKTRTLVRGLAIGALGAGLGALAVHGLHAQAKPPVYAVIEVARITDAAAYATIGPRGGPSVVPFGGKFLARTDRITPADGHPPERYVVIAFDTLDKAQAWRESPAMKEIWAVQEKSSRSRIFFVEGVAQ